MTQSWRLPVQPTRNCSSCGQEAVAVQSCCASAHRRGKIRFSQKFSPGRRTALAHRFQALANSTYELIRDFFKLPDGESFGLVSRVAADGQDRIYVFQRKDPPVVVFDREGKYLGAWGSGEVTDPHGLKIVGETVYTTDRSNSVAKSFTLDGKPVLELGQRGVHSDTGHITDWLARARGRAFQSSDRDDGPPEWRHLRDRRLPRRPRPPLYPRRPAGQIVGHAGPWQGQFHLPHSIAFDDAASSTSPTGRTSASRSSRPTVTSSAKWTGMDGPNDITRGKDGNFSIAEQEDQGKPAYVCVRDGQGNVLARWRPPRPRRRRRRARRHLRRIDHGARRRQVRANRLSTTRQLRSPAPAQGDRFAAASRRPCAGLEWSGRTAAPTHEHMSAPQRMCR